MMPIVNKHLMEKRSAKQTMTNKLAPIPQNYTDDEQEFLNLMTPTNPEQLKQEKGETDDDFWERRSLTMLPKYDWLTPDLTKSKYCYCFIVLFATDILLIVRLISLLLLTLKP